MNRRENLIEAPPFKHAARARAMEFRYELIRDVKARAINEKEKEKS